jgi:adenosine deaminase CECR1
MEPFDTVIKLATEYSTKAVSERVIRLDRLIISVNKIIRSLNERATRAADPQMVHLQMIEDIFFHDPQLFDDALMSRFFSIKDELDSGAKQLPLAGDKYQDLFGDILDKVTKKRNRLRIMARLIAGVVWILIVAIFIWLLIVGVAIAKAKWNELREPVSRIVPSDSSDLQFTDPKKIYEHARTSLKTKFFNPYVTADLLKEVGWDTNDQEAAAVLEQLKKKVTSRPGYYDNPWEARWFVSVRDSIGSTRLFTFLQKMPKGAILHVHPSAMGDYERLVTAAAAYTETGKRFYVSEQYREQDPAESLFVLRARQPSGYIPLGEALANHRQKLLATLMFTAQDRDYPGDIWKLFQPVFKRVSAFFKIAELDSTYYRQAFEYLARVDNISHVELRIKWDPSNEGKPGKRENRIIGTLKGLDLSMKAIWSDSRLVNEKGSSILNDIVKVGRIMASHPDSRLIGFDLSGEEDAGHTTHFFLDTLLAAYSQLGNFLPPMFFHDGESNLPPHYAGIGAASNRTPSEDGYNNNLLDAYLMNTLKLPGFTLKTARVGHGIELFKTPALERYFREAKICVELCPVSNQLLRYIADIREHPGQVYLADCVPVSLNPDDPAIYGYQGVTYDFWEACIAWNLDLKALKVLAYYSLKYSGLEDVQKSAAIQKWHERWADFAKATISMGVKD